MSTLAGLVTASGDGKVLPLLGTLKASGLQTGGSFEIIEYEGPIHPPPHTHREREEAFYVLTGSFTFTLGMAEFDVGAGGFVLVPRGTRHGFTAAAGASCC
jgi:quercetin dioxygenase-like cupin family protein